MANFESSVKVIPYSQERVYNKLVGFKQSGSYQRPFATG